MCFNRQLSVNAEHTGPPPEASMEAWSQGSCCQAQLYIPVLRTLLTAGGAELIDSPDRLCSIPAVPGADKDGGLTEDSWT